MKNKTLIYFFSVLMSLVLIAFAENQKKFKNDNKKDQKYCPLCSMNLKMFWKTTHWLTFSDEKKVGYCSIHCASKEYKKRGIDIYKWEVVDYDTKKIVNAYNSYFLIGSNLPGTMTPVSKLAFASQNTVKTYQKKYGGIVGKFDDALNKALEGMGDDLSMIKKNMSKMSLYGKKLSEKYKCFHCHGKDGSGGKAIAWNSMKFQEKMKNRVIIKERITGFPHEKEKFQDTISEKELHSIVIYIWTKRLK